MEHAWRKSYIPHCKMSDATSEKKNAEQYYNVISNTVILACLLELLIDIDTRAFKIYILFFTDYYQQIFICENFHKTYIYPIELITKRPKNWHNPIKKYYEELN